MNMIERVARAICASMGELPDTETPHHPKVTHLWQHYIPSARAAIEAMRETTEEMLDAVAAEEDKLGYCASAYETLEIERAWPIMISAALKEE